MHDLDLMFTKKKKKKKDNLIKSQINISEKKNAVNKIVVKDRGFNIN